jgi:3-oxoacyl-[acyl-carrier-protein] synthase II
MTEVFISGCGMVSAAGLSVEETFFVRHPECEAYSVGGAIRIDQARYEQLMQHRKSVHLRNADPAVQLGVFASREASKHLARDQQRKAAVICASSRGATTTIESQYTRFVATQTTSPFASPSSTMGSFSAAIAADLQSEAMHFSLSSACTGSLHAVAMGAQLLQAGFCEDVICGGAESACTPFTLAQLKAAGIYADDEHRTYQPFSAERSGMVLGEGAAMLCLSTKPAHDATLSTQVLGFGASSELSGATGISDDARSLQVAMSAAIRSAKLTPNDIDVIVTHGAGTIRGDSAELNAYHAVFGARLPCLTSFKWRTGHTLGAAGAMSLVFAVEQIKRQQIFALPYAAISEGFTVALRSATINHCMVVGLGFGGNAAVLILGAAKG